MADSLRVIARDDLDIDSLLGKKSGRSWGHFPGCGSAAAAAPKIPAALHPEPRAGQAGLRCILPAAAHGGLCQQRGKSVRKLPGAGPRQNIRCAHHITALRAEILGTVLVRRVKGHRAHRKPAGAPCPSGRSGRGRCRCRAAPPRRRRAGSRPAAHFLPAAAGHPPAWRSR